MKGKEWGSNSSSEAPRPVLKYPQLRLGHSTGGHAAGYRDAVLPWVRRISASSHIASEMARLHVVHGGVLGIHTIEGGVAFSSSCKIPLGSG